LPHTVVFTTIFQVLCPAGEIFSVMLLPSVNSLAICIVSANVTGNMARPYFEEKICMLVSSREAIPVLKG
jgi:hypothetical protein